MRRILGGAILSLVLGAGLAGCAGFLDRMREHTYPPSFDYISKEQLQSVMWRMAGDAKQIDKLVHAEGGPTPAQRAEIERLLGSMLEASKQLGDQRTNHARIDEHRDAFRADLEAARRGVQSEPPSYTLAENVAGACVHCHARSTR
jgi:hypothetical protein